jgi:hypothetical protein
MKTRPAPDRPPPLGRPRALKRKAVTPAVLKPIKPRHGFGAVSTEARMFLADPTQAGRLKGGILSFDDRIDGIP